MELHIFVDASEKTYGAVVHIKAINNGNVSCNFVLAKSRLTPINKSPFTIPRLELEAALIAPRLVKSKSRKHKKETDTNFVLWSHSKIWLSDSQKLTFIGQSRFYNFSHPRELKNADSPWTDTFLGLPIMLKYNGLFKSVAFAQNWGILQTRMNQGGLLWKWILTIFKYKNKCYKQLERKKQMKNMAYRCLSHRSWDIRDENLKRKCWLGRNSIKTQHLHNSKHCIINNTFFWNCITRSAKYCQIFTFSENLKTTTFRKTRQIIPFFSSTFSALFVTFISEFEIPKIHFHVVPSLVHHGLWNISIFGQKQPIRTAHQTFLESRHPKVTKNLYYALSTRQSQVPFFFRLQLLGY